MASDSYSRSSQGGDPLTVTKEEGAYIIGALLRVLLAFALLSYIVFNEYRHWQILEVNKTGDKFFKQLTEADEMLMKDVGVLKGIHYYVFKELNDEARPTLP